MKKAVITGVAGQDGSYLSELLLSNDYVVYGVVRRSSIPRYDNINHLLTDPNFHIVEGDITDPSSVNGIVKWVQPDEYYNLAAQSHVKTSFDQPTTTFNINTVGVLNALEAIKDHSKKTRFYQASTSEMFGQNYRSISKSIPINATNDLVGPIFEKIQDEQVPFNPRSPYGVAKLAAHELVRVYRESYGLHASCGILFNHESERRGYNFVTRKITRWLGQFYRDNRFNFDIYDDGIVNDKEIKEWFQLSDDKKLRLGNLEAVRDWGHAEDFVRAMWLMLQQDQPDDYVISTGEGHTVAEFLDVAFKHINPNLYYQDFVIIDPSLYRPSEVDYLCGLSRKAKQKLNWKPQVSFTSLVHRMVDHDKS